MSVDKLARDRAYYYAHREERQRIARERYQARRQAGLCGDCGRRRPRPGKTSCTVCARRRSVRKAPPVRQGKCLDCPEFARPHRVRCLDCARVHSLKQRVRRGSVGVVVCQECGGEGHNRRTCEQAAAKAA